MNNNSDKHNHSLSWDIDYDGRQADIDLHMETDGNEKHMQFQLDNEDLAKMLNYASESQNIEERLLQDFPIDTNTNTNDLNPIGNYNLLNGDVLATDENDLVLYDPPVENSKIKIKIIPKSRFYTSTRRKRRHSRRKPKASRIITTRKNLLTGKMATGKMATGKRPKTMRIKLHEVK
jgi:hypothetical protein